MDGIPPELDKLAKQLLDQQFRGKSRRYVSAHLDAFFERFLNMRFGTGPRRPALRPTVTKPATKAAPTPVRFDAEITEAERTGYYRQLASVPAVFRKLFFDNGGAIHFVAGDVTETQCGVPERFKEAAGCQRWERILVSSPRSFIEMTSTVAHEVGHAVDEMAGDLSEQPEWRNVWWMVRQNLGNHYGEREDAGEAFAEAFSLWCGRRGNLHRPATALASQVVWDYFSALERRLSGVGV